jgi:hypothetical protein
MYMVVLGAFIFLKSLMGTRLTDTRSDGRATLLVALGAAVASEPSDAVLAGTLTRGLVAGPTRRSHGVTLACFQLIKTTKSQNMNISLYLYPS